MAYEIKSDSSLSGVNTAKLSNKNVLFSESLVAKGPAHMTPNKTPAPEET